MCRPDLSEREKALPVCRASAAPFHVIKLCNATAHGKQHTDECKYHFLPAVSARLAEGAVGRKENANMRPGEQITWSSAPLGYLHVGQIEEEGRETTEHRIFELNT